MKRLLLGVFSLSLFALYIPSAYAAPPCGVSLDVSNDPTSATFSGSGPAGMSAGLAVKLNSQYHFFYIGEFNATGGFHQGFPLSADMNGQTVDFQLWASCGHSELVSHLFNLQDGGGDDAEPMFSANRTSGMAPLAVTFDAVMASSAVVQPQADSNGHKPFETFQYDWEFDDDPTATWSTNNLSKNKARGYIAAHVFETARAEPYRVRLTVTEPSGQQHEYVQEITVSPFSGTTYYVSEEGSDSNDGLSEGAAFRTWGFATQRLKNTPAPARLRFKRGDTFDCEDDFSLGSDTGPYQLDAYGSGNTPVINCTNSEALKMVPAINPTRDIRVVDLYFNGNGSTNHRGVNGMGENFLCLRSTFTGFRNGISVDTPDEPVHTFANGNQIVDCTLKDNYRYGIFYNRGGHVAIQGTIFDNIDKEHLLRPYLRNSVIAHNILKNSTDGKSYIKLVGLKDPNKSEFVILADNQFLDPSGGSVRMLSIGPQNDGAPEHSENIIVERNLWNIVSENATAIQSRGANYITVRNNLFRDMRRAVSMSDPVPGFSTWNGWKVYNNTYYNSKESGSFAFIESEESLTNLDLRNNITSAPIAPNILAIDLNSTSLNEVTTSNNTWHLPGMSSNEEVFRLAGPNFDFDEWVALPNQGSASINLDPRFVAAGGNLRLQSGSPAIDAGIDLDEVFEDFDGQSRPQSDATDMGAFEQ